MTSSKLEFLEALREALVNVGFFYLRNAPVHAQTQEDFTKKALDLFDLPLQKKLEIEMVNSPHFLGYSRLGAEITALKPDHREQFDVGTRFTHLRVFTNLLLKFATELPAPGPDEPLYRNVVGPNQVNMHSSASSHSFPQTYPNLISGPTKEHFLVFERHSINTFSK